MRLFSPLTLSCTSDADSVNLCLRLSDWVVCYNNDVSDRAFSTCRRSAEQLASAVGGRTSQPDGGEVAALGDPTSGGGVADDQGSGFDAI